MDAGYYTANLKTMDGEEIGSGKLDLNFVNEGKLYDGGKWEELKGNQPFFAQMNTLECEYDIYDRNTWRQLLSRAERRKVHQQIATSKRPESTALLS